jgi:hypothetical protein
VSNRDIGIGTNGCSEDVIAKKDHGDDEDGGFGSVCGDNPVL